MAMVMAAFSGISWYVGVEINFSLFMRFKKRRGLYFWSCALSSWGVILQPVFIILADFGVWTDLRGSITMIYLTWFIMVVPQSWVLYSRLHLIMQQDSFLRWVAAVLIFDSIVLSVPTVIMGILAASPELTPTSHPSLVLSMTTNIHIFVQQATNIDPGLPRINTVWDRLQTTAFFVQETSLNILYIWQTHKFLRSTRLLREPTAHVSAASQSGTAADRITLLYQLIYINMFVIALDVALLVIQYTFVFYLQGAFKPCVYGVKLKVEFVILNRLIDSLQARGTGQRAYRSGGLTTTSGDESAESRKKVWWLRLVNPTTSSNKTTREGTQGSEGLGLEHLGGLGDHVRRLESQGSRDPIVRRLGVDAPGFAEGRGGLAPFHWQQYGGYPQNDIGYIPR